MTAYAEVAPARDAPGRCGGTLLLYGPGDVDCLDPAVAPPHARQIVRLFSRQLLTYEAHTDLRDWRCFAPVADVATDVPSTYNAGLGASHRSYVLHLRPGVLWDTSPPRPVTAHDFVRGFKRLANSLTRSPALTYFRSTVRGMAEFCDGFGAAVPPRTATAEQLAAYQNAHEIPGVFALDDTALVIELVRASPDFVHLLALTAASAAPVEYDAFLPGGVDLCRNLRSNGPYRVASYLPGRRLRLEPNPVWRPEADQVRGRAVDNVEVAVEDVDPAEVADRLDAGRADLPWGPPVPLPPVGRRRGQVTDQLGWDLDPYLVFNLASGSTAVADVRVRRAVAAAIDKVAMRNCCGALGTAAITAGSIVPPYNDAHRDEPIDRTTTGGNPHRARALLDDAGYARGLVVTAVFERGGFHEQVAALCAAEAMPAGIELRLVGVDRAGLDRLALDDAATRPAWDLMVRAQTPEWHHQNGRVFLQSMFQTGAAANVGGFSDPLVDELIVRALEAAVDAPPRAAAAWHEVEQRVLELAVVVPLLFRAPTTPPRHSTRLRNQLAMPAFGYAYDLTALWLDGEEQIDDDA